MGLRDYLSDDGYVIVALCSTVALPTDAREAGLKPFSLAEWNNLARKIQTSTLKRPAALADCSPERLASELSIMPDEAGRIAALLQRLGQLALELENLFGRGIWALTRADERYPARLRERLKHQAPTVLFGSGELQLLGQSGVAVVGSRNIDEPGAAFAQMVGRKVAASRMVVVSGGARGTDRLAMAAALECGGKAIGVLADSLDRTIRQPDLRQLLIDSQLVLLTPYGPTAGFSVGAAMGRNKVIYGLADYAVIVSSEHETGGTWAGAVEALKGKWCPVLTRVAPGAPKGNTELLKLGASAFNPDDLIGMGDFREWAGRQHFVPEAQPDLFGANREGGSPAKL